MSDKLPDPRECEHVLAHDNRTDTVYCTVCMWWWDADFETPNATPTCTRMNTCNEVEE